MQRYNKGDKVKTTDTWNNGFGTIIPKGSIVTVIFDDTRKGVTCRYNNKEIYYEYEWLGDVVEKGVISWIPTSERLPETTELVIITFKDKYRGTVTGTTVGCYIRALNTWVFQPGKPPGDFNVIAWQPLPQPYKEV